MPLVVTEDGIARRDGDELAVLDLPHPNLSALVADPDVDLSRLDAVPVLSRLPAATSLVAPFSGSAPSLRPGKVWVVGLNYVDHAAEAGAADPPKRPLVYLCPGSAAVGPGAAIRLPTVAPTAVDYEGEVAVVIGRSCREVTAAEAWDYIAGVTACNDVTARDVQGWALRGGGVDIALSKSFDSFKPLGPGLLTVDELECRDDVGVRTMVNGELRQQDSTRNLSFGVGEIVEYLSRFTTLDPGDVIATGSPAGVGFATGSYLAPGDTVTVEVGSALGPLTNPVVPA